MGSKCMTEVKDDGNQGLPSKPNGTHELQQNYLLTPTSKVIGCGTFGKVFLTQNRADQSFQVAIKVFNKTKFRKSYFKRLKEELKILSTLDHPNIVKYYEHYEDTQYMYLVMEYCSGGELFEKIASQKNQVFNESEAASIMKKLLRAINHCHSQGVIHRDIKPENIMFGEDGEIKLIDFGLSRKMEKKSRSLSTVAGTLAYMAPEIIRGQYGKECDIWSLGVLLYVLVSGYLPFQGENRAKVQTKILLGRYHFKHVEFDKVSEEGKSLIKKMLNVNQKERITAEQALRDPWFQKFKNVSKGGDEDVLDPRILERLRSYKGVSALKKAAMGILVKMADHKSIEHLEGMFMKMDKDQTGDITENELKEALIEAHMPINDKELESIVDNVDSSGDRLINYTEYLSAAVNVKDFLTEDRLRAIFQSFDVDRTGKITAENIANAMRKLGHYSISENDIREIMEHHDKDRDGFITQEEFAQIFL